MKNRVPIDMGKLYEDNYKVWCSMLVSWDKGIDDAHDIVMTAYMKGYDKYNEDGFNDEAHAKNYIQLALWHNFIMYLRKRSVEIGEINFDEFEDSINNQLFEQETAYANLIERIREAIKRLSKRRRLVSELYFFEGKSLAEISVILNIELKTARNTFYKSIKILRKKFGDLDLFNDDPND